MGGKAIDIMRRLLDFTYDDYTCMLEFLKSKYNIIPFMDYKDSPSPKLLLRHDVDGSLSPAVRMAELEKSLEIRSTYFVLLSGKHYSVFEKSSLQKLRRISEMGHEIGLHYDVAQYEDYDRPLQETLDREIRLVEGLVGQPVTAIARHNVSLSGHDPFKGSLRPLNAYSDELFQDALYVSDSCRAWYLDHLHRLLTGAHPVVQLLIHPMLWSAVRCSRYELLDLFFKELEEENMTHRADWESLWRNTSRVKMFDAEVRRWFESRGEGNPKGD